ncbi:restriction endonuclease [Promicromonospora sp. AC04]|uniref:restriction endonuclease n=1 Tax=Promicromonospora sp. AC04 TaxID=2135723 RepID=UPI000D3DA3C2|nr:restriction endonuclease [Promicromonospora sp. AC04]PUB20185.1 restriction endonuclease [Promicromonospora sp. AC04]
MKRISLDGYQALCDVLATATWYKPDFERFVRALFRDQPTVLAGLNFSATKREVAGELVDQLIQRDLELQAATLRIMSELAGKTRFPDIERMKKPDREQRLREAREAVARLAEVMAPQVHEVEEKERLRVAQEARLAKATALRQFEDHISGLQRRFQALHQAANQQARGYELEKLLADLFQLFDMEPRLSYSTATEQIDGSLSFDTDDYIVEAKWHAGPVGRPAADVFDAKVRRKGKNALGLFVAVNGFTSDTREVYRVGTSFLTMDGMDLHLVLDGRIRLDELMRAKRRHANETGSCYFPATDLLGAG